jgi:hypothetical protein
VAYPRSDQFLGMDQASKTNPNTHVLWGFRRAWLAPGLSPTQRSMPRTEERESLLVHMHHPSYQPYTPGSAAPPASPHEWAADPAAEPSWMLTTLVELQHREGTKEPRSATQVAAAVLAQKHQHERATMEQVTPAAGGKVMLGLLQT